LHDQDIAIRGFHRVDGAFDAGFCCAELGASTGFTGRSSWPARGHPGFENTPWRSKRPRGLMNRFSNPKTTTLSGRQNHFADKNGNGAPEEIRTPDPQIRSLVLYPAELRARFSQRPFI
jgi:hypothetical protein